MIKERVLVPLLNVNEPEAQVVELYVEERQWIDADSPICTLETTKTSVEVTSSAAGYIRQLSLSVGDTVAAQELICVIADSRDEPVEIPSSEPDEEASDSAGTLVPEGLRITKPAQALARELGFDLSQMRTYEGIITEAVVRDVAGPSVAEDRETPIEPQFDMQIIVFGGGGHAKSVIDLLRQLHVFRIRGIIDDALPSGTTVLGVPILGTRDKLPELLDAGVRLAGNAVGGISDITTRVEVFRTLAQLGFGFPILRHPESVVEPSSVIEDGVQIFANAYVGSDVVLREGCIINTGAIVSHDCMIGEYSHITPGAVLAGGVRVGARTLIGMGVTTAIGIHIGNDAKIGNGALLHEDVPDGTIVKAGTIGPVDE